jgi:hypothetical protein
MFRIDQIISATTFIRSFGEIAKRLFDNQEPLLIAQRNGRFIVVMDAAFFEGMMDARAQIQSMEDDFKERAPYDLKT